MYTEEWYATIDSIVENFVKEYTELVKKKFPDFIHRWPVVSGYSFRYGELPNGWFFAILAHTGKPYSMSIDRIPLFSFDFLSDLNFYRPDHEELQVIRSRVTRHLDISRQEALFLFESRTIQSQMQSQERDWKNIRSLGYISQDFEDHQELVNIQLADILQQHEVAMGLAKMKIFLSHKSEDKKMVEEFNETLIALGFETWFDKDNMSSSAPPIRGAHKGMSDCCAVIFFITPNFKDKAFLEKEINQALNLEQESHGKFKIVPLAFNRPSTVTLKEFTPTLLYDNFTINEPENWLTALRKILKELPIEVGKVSWKEQAKNS